LLISIILTDSINPKRAEKRLREFVASRIKSLRNITQALDSGKILFDHECVKILEPLDIFDLAGILIALRIPRAYILTPKGPELLFNGNTLLSENIFYKFNDLLKWYEKNHKTKYIVWENALFHYPPTPSLEALLNPTFARLGLNSKEVLSGYIVRETHYTLTKIAKNKYLMKKGKLLLDEKISTLVAFAAKIAHLGNDPREGKGLVKNISFKKTITK